MLLSETSYNAMAKVAKTATNNDVISAIAERLAADSTRYSTKFSVRDEQDNVITITRNGSNIIAYVNNTLACKGEASDNYAKDAKDIYWWVRRVLTNTEVADPLDSIANSVHAEEAENRSVNRNYPAYMR